jgi:hypothetical protein
MSRTDWKGDPIPDVAGGQEFKPSKVMEGGLLKLLETYTSQRLASARTCLPAKVINVDYDRSLVNVEPLIRTIFDPVSMEELEIPEVLEVPILFQSAKRGVARMTFPVSTGTTGLLFFSDRHTEKFLASDGVNVQDSKSYYTIGTDYILNTIGFLPEIFTYANAMPFAPNDVVLTNGVAETRHKENGTIISKNEVGTCTLNPSGEISLENGNGFIKLLEDGSVNINGFIIQPTGAATSPVSVGAPTLAAATSLTVASKEMSEHNHSAGSYVVGSDNVSGTSGDPV